MAPNFERTCRKAVGGERGVDVQSLHENAIEQKHAYMEFFTEVPEPQIDSLGRKPQPLEPQCFPQECICWTYILCATYMFSFLLRCQSSRRTTKGRNVGPPKMTDDGKRCAEHV